MRNAMDLLIVEGVVESRSDAVRQGLALLVDRHVRARVAAAIVRGYTLIRRSTKKPRGPTNRQFG